MWTHCTYSARYETVLENNTNFIISPSNTNKFGIAQIQRDIIRNKLLEIGFWGKRWQKPSYFVDRLTNVILWFQNRTKWKVKY